MSKLGSLALAALAAASISVSLGAGSAFADTNPRSVDPPPGTIPWSDCIFASPLPSANALVDSYGNARLHVGISLRCGNHDESDATGFGVRHIRDRHGFDDATEVCIQDIVNNATSLSAASNPRNQALVFRKNGMTGTVIYNVDTKNVVTAFTSGTSGSGDWHGCTSKLA